MRVIPNSRKIVSGVTLTLLLIGMLTLAFEVQPAKSDWAWTETIFIRTDGSVDPDTTPLSSIDNVTYTLTDHIVGNIPALSSAVRIERDNIVFNGAGYIVQGTWTSYSNGISLSGRSNVTIKNMHVKKFYYGIHLYGSTNCKMSLQQTTVTELRCLGDQTRTSFRIIMQQTTVMEFTLSIQTTTALPATQSQMVD